MNNIISIIIAILILAYIGYNEFFRGFVEYETTVDTVRVVRVDTIEIEKLVPYKEEVFRTDTILITERDTILLTDTVFVFDDYFVERKYTNVLDLDTLGSITAHSTVHRNKLTSLVYETNIQIPQYTIVKEPSGWGIGVMGGYKTISPTIIRYHNNFGYIGNYNFIRNEVQAGIFFNF